MPRKALQDRMRSALHVHHLGQARVKAGAAALGSAHPIPSLPFFQVCRAPPWRGARQTWKKGEDSRYVRNPGRRSFLACPGLFSRWWRAFPRAAIVSSQRDGVLLDPLVAEPSVLQAHPAKQRHHKTATGNSSPSRQLWKDRFFSCPLRSSCPPLSSQRCRPTCA